MKNSLEIIKNFSKENNVRVEIKHHLLHSKAFKENYIFNKYNSDFELKFKEHERSKEISEKFLLGFKNSQALVAFYRNTPNNTLPTFWWTSSKWNGLFPRGNKRPSFLRKRTNRQIKAAYHLSSREGLN